MPSLPRKSFPAWQPLARARAMMDGFFQFHEQTFRGFQAVVDSWHVDVGMTPREEVWRLNKARLFHYVPIRREAERHPVPLLLVYALINKPFIFDLGPGRSFVEYLVADGYEVYLLDWGSPGHEDRGLSFDDYVTEYLTRAVRKVLRHSGASAFSLLGYCLGATLVTIFAALYPDTPLRNLILLTAPLDFSDAMDGSLAVWLDDNTLDIDRLIDAYGNVPGQLVEIWAKMLKPLDNFFGSYASLWNMLDDAEGIHGWQAINRWVEEVIPVSGEAFRQFVHDYVRQNELVTGKHRINGDPVDLQQIKARLLNITAEYDHLVSPSQSVSIMDLVSSTDKTQLVIPSTHVGIMASRRAKYKLWPEIAAWLRERSQ